MINFEDSTTSSPDVAEKPVKDWRAKFEAGLLTNGDICKFFSEHAPLYADLETEAHSVRYTYNEASAKANIIDPLIEFICGTNPDSLIEKLKSEINAPSVCGKVFRAGEPTYSCRGCGMDSTCVLCVNCFKQSAHRYHKYKMSTSGGGGCCDCGDEEAWKNDPYCEEHIRGMKKSTENSIITNSMKDRCDIAFRAILMYCVKYLEIESHASLEGLDGGAPGDDLFCTVLYNDESHTFEQVIQTLTKICNCSQKDAMEFVTSIDREGRAVVKVHSFETCFALKEAIERQPMRHSTSVSKSPLRVSVLHRRAVSCQQFALQLLTWFQEFLTLHQIFRQIFAVSISDESCPNYNIGHILEYDWKLWKTARSCWHRIFISGMLMEYENKKILAIQFSKHYSTIIQDFIRDDHDHSISIASLSVQLFTAPTIAHYLIANEEIFYKLMHTFYCESISKYVQNKTLQFAKNTANLNVFKRAAYILYDLRYILSFKPDFWTPELRYGFVEGVKVLLKLLNVMQGMDAVQRQTGQHMDYEPEWESAFNLHIKLALGISLVLDWCSSDQECLVKVYQLVMKHLLDNEFIVKNTVIEEKSLAGHVAPCVMYDVASKPASIHLPLTRFFAGIYLHLGKFGLNFDNATTVKKRTPEEIIEPVLCTQTMIAQVHAGMWRRNGYSLLHQLYFYRNARCRSEMLDRDIAALQIGAALIESNQYLIHILNKFALLEWADPGYESVYRNYTDDEYVRQLNMIDEFLELLIVVIGERFVPGIGDVTEEDRIKKEIIQLLCIKNFSHSELNRCFPDSNNEMALEDVIESIAVFKKPQQGNAKGVYELKEEHYDDYNMYFYHYTKEDKSKSEENQRSRRKTKNQLVCCPPPKLPKLAEGFVSIANLLQCDVMISVMRTVLSRALDLKAKSFTESHLQKILHLIGYGLVEEESGHYPFLTFYERAVEQDILNLLEKLTHSPRVEAHRDFIIWTVKKFKELQPKVNDNEMETDDQNEPMTTAEAERREKEERARLAAERRAKIMTQMANAQKNFMKSNAELFASTSTSYTSNETMEWQEPVEDEDNQSVACIGPKRKIHQPEEQKFKCILCFEDCVVSKDGQSLVYSAFIQKSKVLIASADSTIPPSPHVGTCGHVMHASCWKEYFENEILKENRRPNRNRSPNNYLIDKKEFLCPYCRCLSNGVIPVSPPLSKYAPAVSNDESPQPVEVLSFGTWISIMQDYLDELYVVERNIDIQDGKTKYPELANIAQKYTDVENLLKMSQPREAVDISAEWLQFAEIFMGSVQRVCPYEHTAEECEPFLVAWNSCAYTIQSLEMYLRAVNRPLKGEMSIRHKSCLSGLIRVCSLIGACITETVAGKLMIHLRGILETVFKHKGSSVVEWDVFHMLTSFVFLEMVIDFKQKSHLVPTGDCFEYYFLQLMFLGNLAKTIVLYRNDTARSMEVDPCEPDAEPADSKSEDDEVEGALDGVIGNFYRKYNLQLKEDGVAENVAITPSVVKQIIEHVKRESRTFLRCSCLLFHFMTDVEFPDQFCDVNGDTFETMCKYLGLNPEVESYFDPESVYFKTLESFAGHPNIQQHGNASGSLECIPCVIPVRKLVKLPDDYSDLINSVSDFTCPSSPKEESRNPTMCLVCGAMLCSQSYCCQPELVERSGTVGACTHHAHFCGADIGMFLRIRDCEILILGIAKGCFVSPPYLDEYGETDQGLRRGNPLRLCHERYNKLHLMWLGHGLHEEIARLTENTNSVIATQWQHI